MDWWIYSNKSQEEKRDSRLKDMLKKIKNQSMNLIWTLIQTIKKSITQLEKVKHDLLLNTG